MPQEIVKVLSDVPLNASLRSFRHGLCMLMQRQGIDQKHGKLYFAAGKTDVTEIILQATFTSILAQLYAKRNSRSSVGGAFSIGASHADNDEDEKPTYEEEEEDDSQGYTGSDLTIYGLRDPPVRAAVLTTPPDGRAAAAQANTQRKRKVKEFVDFLYTDQRSPFYHGFTR